MPPPRGQQGLEPHAAGVVGNQVSKECLLKENGTLHLSNNWPSKTPTSPIREKADGAQRLPNFTATSKSHTSATPHLTPFQVTSTHTCAPPSLHTCFKHVEWPCPPHPSPHAGRLFCHLGGGSVHSLGGWMRSRRVWVAGRTQGQDVGYRVPAGVCCKRLKHHENMSTGPSSSAQDLLAVLRPWGLGVRSAVPGTLSHYGSCLHSLVTAAQGTLVCVTLSEIRGFCHHSVPPINGNKGLSEEAVPRPSALPLLQGASHQRPTN